MDEIDLAAEYRSVTGVLSSHADSMDLHFGNLSILFHGAELLVDSTLDLNVGKRYGLIGMNGCGQLVFHLQLFVPVVVGCFMALK